MTRKPREGRSSIVDSTLTLRLTREDRMLLNELVGRRSKQARRDGMETTIASYVRALIRNEAEAQGIRVDPAAECPASETLLSSPGSGETSVTSAIGERSQE